MKTKEKLTKVTKYYIIVLSLYLIVKTNIHSFIKRRQIRRGNRVVCFVLTNAYKQSPNIVGKSAYN